MATEGFDLDYKGKVLYTGVRRNTRESILAARKTTNKVMTDWGNPEKVNSSEHVDPQHLILNMIRFQGADVVMLLTDGKELIGNLTVTPLTEGRKSHDDELSISHDDGSRTEIKEKDVEAIFLRM